MRQPNEIIIDGVTLGERLPRHAMWFRGEGGERLCLRGANLSDADLSGADLRRAVLSDAILSGADLRRAHLSGAVLSDAEMRGANLRGADLSDAVLCDAEMRGADLSGAHLRGADLSGADLSDSNLRDADLRRAVLSDAILSGAYLFGADLRRADLRRADLSGADLSDVVGNMREIKSAQIDRWALVWTTDPDGEVTLSIGCQSHPLEMWEKSDPRWIATLDDDATEWWAQYRDVVLALVKASPATPWGKQEDNG